MQASSGEARKKQVGERSMPAQLNNVASRINTHDTIPFPLPSTCEEVEKVHTFLPTYQNAHLNFVSSFPFRRGKPVLLKMQV